MIFVGSRPEDVARLAQARRFFILRGIQAITSILFIVCLVNAAVKMRNSGEGVSAKSYAISVAISLIIGGLSTLATLFLALLAILQYRYDSFVAIHRPGRTRRIILLQSITDTLLSTLWLATFLEMLIISRLKPLDGADATHMSLPWYLADGFAGICWLLFLYAGWLLASSIYMFKRTRTGGPAPIPLQPKAVTNEPLI